MTKRDEIWILWVCALFLLAFAIWGVHELPMILNFDPANLRR